MCGRVTVRESDVLFWIEDAKESKCPQIRKIAGN